MKWHGDVSLDDVATEALSNKKMTQAECCNEPRIHIYAWRGDKKGGLRNSAWIWCSKCGAYSHLDGLYLHDDWDEDPKIDNSKLTAVPKYQNENADEIDSHFERFMRGEL